jgi:hypothetical protein
MGNKLADNLGRFFEGIDVSNVAPIPTPNPTPSSMPASTLRKRLARRKVQLAPRPETSAARKDAMHG